MPENSAEKCKEAFALPRAKGEHMPPMRARRRARSRYHGGLFMDQFEEAIKLRNLYRALKKCCAGTMWKDGTAVYRSDGLENSARLRADLKAGRYKIQRYMRFSITRPKPRSITATRIRDRHAQRSACDNILYPILTRSFIHDNGACQTGKGVDFAIERMKYWLRRVYRAQRRERARAADCRVEDVGPFQADALIYKGDVRKYFPTSRFSVAKATLRKAVASDRLAAFFCAVVESFGEEWWEARLIAVGAPTPAAAKAARAITDARVERESLPLRPEGERDGILRECERKIRQAVQRVPGLSREGRAAIIDEALHGDARGIGLGSQISQLVQLAQLNAMDHYAKEEARAAVYVRYMDDFILYDPDPEKLKRAVRGIAERLDALGLELNPKSQFIRLRKGFIFLRWHFYLTPTGKVILRAAPGVAAAEKRRLKRMGRRIAAGKGSPDSLRRHYEGWRAHMARGNTRELLRSMDKYFAAILDDIEGGRQ